MISNAVWETGSGSESIETDEKTWSYLWRSRCGRAELRLHFNKAVAFIKYPVRIPRSENDDFEAQINKTRLASKYIYKYTTCEQEISIMNPPAVWSELLSKMIEIVSENDDGKTKPLTCSTEIKVNLPEAMPLSCASTHMHRFDDLLLNSEPKVIFIDNMCYKYTDRSYFRCFVFSFSSKETTKI